MSSKWSWPYRKSQSSSTTRDPLCFYILTTHSLSAKLPRWAHSQQCTNVVVIIHKPSGTVLYHLNLVNVGLCVGIPYHCSILDDGSHQGHVCLFFDGWRAGTDVSPEESTGVVGFLSSSVDMFVPTKFSGDLYTESTIC